MAALGADADEKDKVKVLEALKRSMAPAELQEYLDMMRTIKELKASQGVQMRMPYQVTIH